VQEQFALVSELPAEALARETVFRDNVTSGMHQEKVLTPSVFELSRTALNDLYAFMGKAEFDMDVTLFEHFNQAFRQRRT
jgi:hypothetical protein